MKNQNKPVIWKSIILAFPCFLFYNLIYLIVGFLSLGFLYLLSRVEILNNFLGWVFYSRGDSPSMFSICFSATMAYYVTGLVQEKIIKHFPTLKLLRIIVGSIIIISNILFLFVNL